MNRTCLLCAAAGHDTPANWRSLLCDDHLSGLAASGRQWCPRGRHVVLQRDCIGPCCAACNRARFRLYPRPAGFVSHKVVAQRLYIHTSTLMRWLSLGWPVAHQRYPGSAVWVEERETYPPPPDRRRGRYRGGETRNDSAAS